MIGLITSYTVNHRLSVIMKSTLLFIIDGFVKTKQSMFVCIHELIKHTTAIAESF